MADEENVVTQPDSTPDTEVVEPHEPAAAPPDQGDKENRIPISRAEEMWQRREAKARADWEEKHLKPLQSKNAEYEKVLSTIAKGQLEFGRQLGVIPPEKPPAPLTRDEFESMFTERMAKVEEQQRAMYHQARITSGWEQVASKYPKWAGNKQFQQAALNSYSQNPEMPMLAHAESIIKDLLDPYANDRAGALAAEKEKQLTPDRRVVPSGRGAAGGSGGKPTKKQSVAEKIQARLRASKEE
jgi:hypothetical protein